MNSLILCLKAHHDVVLALLPKAIHVGSDDDEVHDGFLNS